jgi:cold shock CspA family protein
MAKSQQSFNKKEREKKRRKRKQEKAEKREQKKLDGKEKKSFEDMLMYVDEDGNLTSTPPDPKKKKKIKMEDIEIGAANREGAEHDDGPRKGMVKFFNEEKGYGFINVPDVRDSIFVHAAGLIDQIREGDKVTFEIEIGQKGPVAVQVKVVK